MSWRPCVAFTVVTLAVVAGGCGARERGPTDGEVIAAVQKSPPAPPTLGPTYLASVDAVEVEERGRYHGDGRYWPVRVRVKGRARIKVTNPFQLGLVDERARTATEQVDFAEEVRLVRDDYGGWRASYVYDSKGPAWRVGGSETPGPGIR